MSLGAVIGGLAGLAAAAIWITVPRLLGAMVTTASRLTLGSSRGLRSLVGAGGVDRSGHQDRLADDRRGTTGAGGHVDGVLGDRAHRAVVGRSGQQDGVGPRDGRTVGGDGVTESALAIGEFDRRIRGSEFCALSLAHSRNVLRHLGEGPMRASELVERCDVSKQAISQQIAHLAANDYVALDADPRDARARLVRLTTKGERANSSCEAFSSRSSATGRASSGSRSSTACATCSPAFSSSASATPATEPPLSILATRAFSGPGGGGPARAADEVGDPVAPRPCAADVRDDRRPLVGGDAQRVACLCRGDLWSASPDRAASC